MKVFLVGVGNIVERDPKITESHYLMAYSLNKAQYSSYLKKDITNQISQIKSLARVGVDTTYGFLSDRKSLLGLFKTGFRIRQISRQKKADLIHVLWGSSAALTTVLFSSAPVIISFCGSDIFGVKDANGKRSFSGKISSLLSQIAALGAKRVIAKSEQIKNTLWPICRKKCTVIPNGIDLAGFYPMEQNKAREKLGWESPGRVIIFFSPPDSFVKDQPLAEKVVSLIRVHMPDVIFEVVDNIPHEDLVYYYNAADLMLLTSYHEGSNNSLKEAMSCNLPVVSVDCGDANERLQGIKNSFVLKSRDPYLLAEKALQVLINGQRSDASKNINELGEENIAHRIAGIYSGLV